MQVRRRERQWILLLLVLACLAGSGVLARAEPARTPAPSTPPGATLTVGDLNPARIQGRLGASLGTILEVEGLAADDRYRRWKSDEGQTLLRILRVNGRPLPREIVYPFRTLSFLSRQPPTPGASFKLRGYETGGFTGIPNEAFDLVPRVATTGFHFETQFIVLKVDGP